MPADRSGRFRWWPSTPMVPDRHRIPSGPLFGPCRRGGRGACPARAAFDTALCLGLAPRRCCTSVDDWHMDVIRRPPRYADLADALAGDVELLPTSSQRVVGVHPMPKRMRSTRSSRGVSGEERVDRRAGWTAVAASIGGPRSWCPR